MWQQTSVFSVMHGPLGMFQVLRNDTRCHVNLRARGKVQWHVPGAALLFQDISRGAWKANRVKTLMFLPSEPVHCMWCSEKQILLTTICFVEFRYHFCCAPQSLSIHWWENDNCMTVGDMMSGDRPKRWQDDYIAGYNDLDFLKVPSQPIRSAWKWYVWIGLKSTV